jgi:hypothetical protein
MDDAKVYNVCLQRVKFQITNAKKRLDGKPLRGGSIVLESYNTGDIEEIIDILELYDLKERTPEGVREKLNDLAYTVSLLVKEKIGFDYDGKGNLGLHLIIHEDSGDVLGEEVETASAAV